LNIPYARMKSRLIYYIKILVLLCISISKLQLSYAHTDTVVADVMEYKSSEDEEYYSEEEEYTPMLTADTSTLYNAPQISNDTWNKLTDDPELDYDRFNKNPNPYLTELLYKIITFLTEDGKWIIWILVIGLVIIISYTIYKRRVLRRGRSGKEMVNDLISNDAYNGKINYTFLIKKALDDNETISAMKLMYQHIVSLLQQQEKLSIYPETTNAQILNRTLQEEYFHSLKELIRYFEYIVFGEYPIDHDRFQHYLQNYQATLSKLEQRIK
jgi:hypothetical protein